MIAQPKQNREDSDNVKEIAENSKRDSFVQLLMLAKNNAIDDDGDRVESQLKTLNDQTKDLVESTKKHNNNVYKLFKDIEINTKSFAKNMGLREINKEEAKEITDKGVGRRQYRLISDRVSDFKDQVKDFFTVRGFLDKTGISKRGSGGILSEYLDRREDRQNYVKDRMKVDPQYINLVGEEKAKKVFADQFDKQQNIQRGMVKNEGEISRLEKEGYKESQIARTGAFDTRMDLAKDLAKVDSRVRPEGYDAKTGLIREKGEEPQIEREEPSASLDGTQQEATGAATKVSLDTLAYQEIAAKNSMSLPQIARDINVARQNLQEMVRNSGGDVKTGADAQFRKSSENESLMMVDKDKRIERMKEEGMEGVPGISLGSEESVQENQRAMDKQNEYLSKISSNTKKTSELLLKMVGEKPEEKRGEEESSGFMGKLKGVGSTLKKAGGKALGAAGSAGRSLLGGAKGFLSAPGGGALASGAAMVAAPFAVDAAVGALGLGNNKIDTEQDDANWERMSLLEKAQSGVARGIEKVGGLFGGNITNEARAARIKSETEYLDSKHGVAPAIKQREEQNQDFKINFSELTFAQNDPENYKKFVEYRDQQTEKYMKDAPRDSGIQRNIAQTKAKRDAIVKFRKEIEAAGAGSVEGGSNSSPQMQAKKEEIQKRKEAMLGEAQEMEQRGVKTRIANEDVVPGRDLSDKQMAVIKMSKSMGNSYSPEIEAQYAKQLKAPKPTSGDNLYRGSTENAAMKEQAGKTAVTPQSTNVVNAPTNNTTVNKVDLPIRKDDSSLNRYTGSRYAY